MRLAHVALWTPDLERSRQFYTTYFQGRAGVKYINPQTGFESYFMSFKDGAKLELMKMEGIPENINDAARQYMGLIHIAFSTGHRDGVDELTERLKSDGHTVVANPRETGDGYYESIVLDPDGNRVEITD